MLIVVLHAALMTFMDEYLQSYQVTAPESGDAAPFWPDFFLGVGMIVFMVIILKLSLGFLKSAATDGPTPHEPMQLLRIGGPYFFRILFFRLLLEVCVSIVTIPAVMLIGGAVWKTGDVSGIPAWFVRMGGLLGMLALMKPLFLVPARILVYEDTIFQALSAFWRYRLTEIDNFLRWMLAGFGVVAVFTLINSLAAAQTPVYYVLTGVYHLVFSLVFLGLTLAVVLRLQQQLEVQQADSMEGTGEE